MGYLLFICLLLSGCQSWTSDRSNELPQRYRKLFGHCQSQGAWFEFHLYQEGDLLLAADLDWQAKSRKDWTAEFTDPVGKTVLRFQYKNQKMLSSGYYVNRIPSLGSQNDGFLHVGDRRTSLRAEEVPCLLSYSLDQSWLDHLAYWDNSEELAVIKDAYRKIELSFEKGNLRNRCVRVYRKILWNWYIEEMTWCQKDGERMSAKIRVPNGFEAAWFSLDE
jgi:hypothetical protein